jgi:hypothetical protein
MKGEYYMNKVNIINSLQAIADSFNALAQELMTTEAAPKATTKVKEEIITEEMVMERLYALSKAGKSAEVRALLNKFGAKKLTEVSKESYGELLKGAELIN